MSTEKALEDILSRDMIDAGGTTSAIFRAIVKLGVNSTQLLNKANLKLEQLDEDDTYKHLCLWQAGHELLKCPEIGLHVGMHSNPNNRGIVGHVFLKSKNLRTALTLIIKYFEIIMTYMSMELTTDHENAYIRFRYSKGSFHQYGIDHIVGAFTNWVNVYLNQKIHYRKVAFQYTKPHNTNLYRETLGCKANYEQPDNVLAFPARLLEFKNPDYNEYLHNVIVEHANTILENMNSNVDFIDKVKKIISKGLNQGRFSAESVADSLNISKRTYQRKLTERHVTHQKLLDEIRHSAALYYMKQNSCELKRLTTILGYADTKGFYRAFKRWTGYSPSEYIDSLNSK
jgi:AraC-like DNA-binding protein